MSQTRAKPSPATQGAGGDRGPKDKALQAAIGEIEKSYGKGAIMRLGDERDRGQGDPGHPDGLVWPSTSRWAARVFRAGASSRSSARRARARPRSRCT